jgi:hypothetical protein
MFISDETINARSQVTFYRCSICVSEHVSSEPVPETASYQSTVDYFDSPSTDKKRYLMI